MRVLRRIGAGLAAFREVWAAHALRRVMLAYAGFVAVEYGTWVAILVYAYSATGPTSVAVVATAQLIPCAIFAPVLASVGDRFPRGRVLCAGYAIQALTMLATSLAILFGAPPLFVYPVAVVAAVAVTMTRPTHGAVLPALADGPEQLTASNSVGSAVEGLGVLLGPALAGVVMTVAGPGEAFLGAATICLVCSIGVRDINVRAPGMERARRERDDGSRTVFGALLRDPVSRSIVEVVSARDAIDGAIDVLLVLVAIELFLTGEAGAAYLQASIGAGLSLGGMATLILVGRRRLAPWLLAGAAVFGFGFAGVAGLSAAPAGMVALSIAGAGLALTDVSGRTLLQRVVPDHLLNRVLGVQEGVRSLALAVGSILVPPTVWLVGVRGAVLVFALLLPAVGLVAWRRLARSDAWTAPPAEALAAIERLPLFAPLPAPDLEMIARRLQRIRFASGQAIITEGAAGDLFYLVESGDLTVTRAGDRIGELHAGDHFGEIALMRDVPRTATVTADGEVTAFVLDRTTFLTAVTGNPRAAEEAERITNHRLARPMHRDT